MEKFCITPYDDQTQQKQYINAIVVLVKTHNELFYYYCIKKKSSFIYNKVHTYTEIDINYTYK